MRISTITPPNLPHPALIMAVSYLHLVFYLGEDRYERLHLPDRDMPLRRTAARKCKSDHLAFSEHRIETVHVRMDRDPGTGRKTINQYVVLHELGYGTHGQVRLGQEIDPVTGDAVDRGQGSYYV